MRYYGLLDAIPLWALFVATLAVALLSFEGGFWFGRRSGSLPEQQQEKVVNRAFSVVILLIEDLDRPLGGYLEVDQQALIDLRNKMKARTQ